MNEDYPVFVKWYKIMGWLMDRCDTFPKSIRFTLTGRIVQLALDIMEGTIEAIYSRRKKDILRNINLKLEKMRVFIRLSYERRYLSISQYEYIATELNEFGKMIGSWHKSCKE